MASNMNQKACRFAHCRHEGKLIDLTTDEYIQNGSSFYHVDCYRDKSNIDFIMSFWKNEIDSGVVYKQLRGILNRLIFTDGYSSDYVAFAVQYCVQQKKPLKYPPGLKYVLSDFVVKKAYELKTKPKKQISQSDFSAKGKDDESEGPKFNVAHKKSGFGGILGGA